MRDHDHDDCRPALLDPTTGCVLPESDPIMQAVLRVWKSASDAERAAYHRFCCRNSRDPADVAHVQALTQRFATAGEREMRAGLS
jgi:hypothetical protein